MRLVLACLVMGFGGGCSALASMDNYSFDGQPDTDSGGDSNGSDDSSSSDSTDGSASSPEDTSTESGDDTETQTSPPSCPAHTHECVEDAVEGWNGPVALYVDDVGTTPPACGGSFPATSLDARTDLVVPTSTCECSCGSATGATCAGTTVLWYHENSSTCQHATPVFIYLTQPCTNMSVVYGNRYWRLDVSGLTVAGGSCEAVPVADVPSVEWGTVLLACGGAQDAGGCGAGSSCLPKPASPLRQSLCLTRQGDVQCPSGSAYSERAVYTTGVADNRACAQCTCGAPAGSCASTSATLESLAGCGPGSVDVAVLPGSGACVQASATNTNAVSLNLVAQASCTASQGILQGTAQATNPVTVCCLAL